MHLSPRFRVVLCVAAAGVLALAGASCKFALSKPPETGVAPPPHPPADGQAKPAAPKAAPKPVAGQPPSPAAPALGAAAGGPLEITVPSAILMALENNAELVVQRENPAIRRTLEDEQRAVFDPVLTGTYGHQQARGQRFAGNRLEEFDKEAIVGGGALGALLPTGTGVTVDVNKRIADVAMRKQLAQTRVGLTVTQALLRGFGLDVNLASIRQARLDTLASEYELRGFAETLVGLVEVTYWDHVLAQRQVEILTQAVEMAEQQLKDVLERVKAGTVAEVDRAAAEAEVALRRRDLIDARSDREKMRLQLLRLMNPPGTDLWGREIRLGGLPPDADEALEDVESHVNVGLRMRPELNQARLGVQRGDLEIVRTRNGLLPKLDLFLTIGRSQYVDSFPDSRAGLRGGPYNDVLLGVSAQFPVTDQAARAVHERAVISRRQAVEAVNNLAQLVQVDVRSAYVEVNRAKEQTAASAASRRLDEAKLQAELEKYKIGRASSFQVARAQRDLVRSQIAEVQAAVDYRKAHVELFRLEGSLLERRGVSAPGRDPVEIAGTKP